MNKYYFLFSKEYLNISDSKTLKDKIIIEAKNSKEAYDLFCLKCDNDNNYEVLILNVFEIKG